MTPLYEVELGVTHNRITNPDETVQEDWGYLYDTDFFTGIEFPVDWRVEAGWVGRKAKDCCPAWEYFIKPILDFQI